jgi:hypothetical protein
MAEHVSHSKYDEYSSDEETLMIDISSIYLEDCDGGTRSSDRIVVVVKYERDRTRSGTQMLVAVEDTRNRDREKLRETNTSLHLSFALQPD